MDQNQNLDRFPFLMAPFDRCFFFPTRPPLLGAEDGDFLLDILANLDILLDADEDAPPRLLATASASLLDFAVVPADRTAEADDLAFALLLPSLLAP